MTCITRRHFLGVLAIAPFTPDSAWAQSDWPSRTIRIVVPYPAGGTPDVATRVLAEQLGPILKTSVIVEAKPGASGLIGMRAVTASPADGHTIGYVSSGQVTLTAMNPKFDLMKELKPVARVTGSPFVVLVAANSPYRALTDLIKSVKANPGKLAYGTAGSGSPAHMAVAYMEDGIKDFKALHVPFKGAVESINAILAGQIDFTIGVLGAAIPHIKAGRLRALAVTPAKRVALLPEVPTIAEAAQIDYEFQSWGGFVAPAGTSDAIIERMSKAIVQAANSDSFAKYLASVGGELDVIAVPAEFGRRLQSSIATEKRIVEKLGLKESA